MRRDLLMTKRNLRLPLEYPFPDALNIYVRRLLITSLIYLACLIIFLGFTGQGAGTRDDLSVHLLVFLTNMVAVILSHRKLSREKSISSDDEIDE
jgi:hypothetical protein